MGKLRTERWAVGLGAERREAGGWAGRAADKAVSACAPVKDVSLFLKSSGAGVQ